jgi:hypothetical protein
MRIKGKKHFERISIKKYDVNKIKSILKIRAFFSAEK